MKKTEEFNKTREFLKENPSADNEFVKEVIDLMKVVSPWKQRSDNYFKW